MDFRLNEISDLKGPLVHQLGKGLREVLEEVLENNRHRLPEKLNRQLARNRDKLRVSLAELLDSEWSGLGRLLRNPDELPISAAPDR